MRVAVIDVGSNTARLLVATVDSDGTVVPVAAERNYLRLGAEIARAGTLGKKKIAATADICGAYARQAVALGADHSTVIVTAPGRQGASAAALTAALGTATGLPVRVLTAEGEGRLAEAVKILSHRPAAKAARTFGIDAQRAETLLAGALLLAGASRVLGTSLELGRGGLREGAALELAARETAQAA